MATKSIERKWWKEDVVFQVYPASFMDTNGDGWGDIPGITAKLDYLKNLGVDIIWVSPIYKSPQADMGYDIADYEDIDPRYGTLEDVDHLIAQLKARDMKLMMDLVVNHTSNEHAWFVESRSSKQSPKRDWYIWKSPRFDANGNRQPPNNWAQLLGEANSAWTYDDATGEYYLSLFTPEQPDLNWENPEVRHAVHDILRFWLDRGACGFRMDVINLISKVQSFPDADVVVPDHAYQPADKYYANGPRLHEYLQEINREVLAKYDTVTVGEMPFVRDEEEVLKVVGADREELNMIFIFSLVDIDNVPGDFKYTLHPWDARDLKQIIGKWQRIMHDRGGWNSLFCENHDQPRSVSRFVDDSDEYREVGAKLLCLMQTTLGGTVYVYQGEELGMRNVPPSWEPDEYKDIESINFFQKTRDMYPNDAEKFARARHILQRKARDNARTPVQWDASPNAGFCPPHVTPWMRVNDDFAVVNAAEQVGRSAVGDPSVFEFWKLRLAERKKRKDVFVYGDFELLDEPNDKVFAYRRFSEYDSFLVVLNFSGQNVEWKVPKNVEVKEWLAGNYTGRKPEKDSKEQVTLLPWEGLTATC
ncbi:alpha-glucosidase-like protein maltase [Lineolata rhizophorae]|uniref:Alpha-glucosidase-like protein maltase n=1 Tax=Lineolata rhizophorae TaxID=578093 RepID=A0A6A6P4R9_9PEZI|nr:alpha-glucosidase-like protein maltase [Lineolata rhizophorae]